MHVTLSDNKSRDERRACRFVFFSFFFFFCNFTRKFCFCFVLGFGLWIIFSSQLQVPSLNRCKASIDMFRNTKRRTAGRRNFETSIHASQQDDSYLANAYTKSKLTFYKLPPVGEITLDEFETWAIDRIKILNEIESCVARNKSYKEIESIVGPLLGTLLPLNTTNSEKLLKHRQKDYYSHFILRLCFSRSKELRDRFLKNELLLFKIRFNQLTSTEQQHFVKSLNLPWEFISSEEKETMSTQLFNSIAPSLGYLLNIPDEAQRRSFFQNEGFIKIPFEFVSDLLPSRCIYLRRGYAYIPSFQQFQLLSNEYSATLSEALIQTSHAFPSLDEDDRILPILNHLSSGSSINFENDMFDGSESNNDINIRNVDTKEIIDQFPLCGSNLMQGLKINNHLKYTARQQFQLFLKGIGLSLEDSLTFWSQEFTKSMSIEKFNKEYKYNIRHTFGLEGGRINYKPWDCRTVLSKPRPQKGEYHGCPYRDLNNDALSTKLRSMELSEGEISDILEISNKGEYTSACSKVLELKTKGAVQEHITHPNLYFVRMREYFKKIHGDGEEVESAA